MTELTLPLTGIPSLLNPLHWSSWTIAALILVCLAVRVCLPSSPSTVIRVLGEALLVAPAALFYFLVRGLVDARQADAVDHARSIIAFEQALGVHREQDLQKLILDSDWQIDLMNWVYTWGHWPVVIATLTWLVLFHHERFGVYFKAVLISGALGMLIFALFPVAPPRLVDGLGFIDTVTERSNAYRLLQPPSLTNQYAAMPSLHFGWNLLLGIAVVREARLPVVRAFGVIMPLLMFASIILTANHYFLDGLVGGLLGLLGLAIGEWFANRKHELRALVFRHGVFSHDTGNRRMTQPR